MYERILVALDGSDLAERVLPYVEALAAKFGSAVTLVRATVSPAELVAPGVGVVGPSLGELPAYGRTLSPMEGGAYDAILEAERTETEQYLEGVAERLRADGLQVTTEHTEGHPSDVIIERATALKADLIAMTTHGRGGIARALLGSVADEVIRKAPCPMLLVRMNEGHGGEDSGAHQ